MSKQVHLRVDDAVYEALNKIAKKKCRSVQDCIIGAIKLMLEKEKKINTLNKNEKQYTFMRV